MAGIVNGGGITSGGGGAISKIKSPFVPKNTPIIAGQDIQQAFESAQGQINNLSKSQVYLGNWDASTNTPELPLIPDETYSLGEYYRVSGNGTFNNIEYTIGDRIAVAIDKANNTLFWDKINLNDETKQDKIFTYTVANLTALNTITGMVAGNTAITLDTLKEYIYTTQWEEVFETLANKNQPNGYAGLDSDNSAYASQLEKPILNFLPRAFYGFEIAGGVATFDNATNTINKNDLLLCTASDGSLTFNKGTLYQIDTTTATPTTAMLSSYLTPSQMVGKTLTLHRDFNNYPKGTYTANDTETDLISYTDLKANQSTTYTKIETDTALDLKQNNIIKVANQTTMLALSTAIVGDIVIRTDDNNYQYRLNALPASNLSNWEVLGKDLLLNTENKFEIGRRIAKQYSSELYDVTAYLKGLTYTNVSTEAQLLAAILVEGFVVKLTNNITLALQINFEQKGVLHLNGFTINASVPTVVVNITKAVIISGGTLAHEKLTDTSVEALVKINTPANERAILHNLTLKHLEFGVDLNGCWALQNVNFEYNTPFGTATDSHRHIAIKTVLGDCFIDNITFSGIPQVATTRYTNFILADITEWTGNLHIRNVKQSAVGALRQFLNFQTLGVNVTAGKLIVQDCNFNDLNGGIFFLTTGALDKMEYIVLTNNEQGGDSIGVFKGLLYFSFTGALGTKSKIIHYNNKTLAGALRADYVSLIPTADTANTGIVARQNTVTINAGQEYAVANKSIVDTFYQDFYKKGENDVALNTKQNITDNTLNTTSKTIVGGINELKISIDGKVVDAINDGVISTAPSQNAVFDALALKQKKVYHYTDTEANILLIDPTANNGKTAKATDTLKEYISNGTAWIEVSGGNSLTVGAVETANFTALANTINPVNTTAGVVIATLPSSPNAGDIVRFTDYANKFATNKLTLNPNGLKINSSTSNVDITTNNSDPTLTYIDATEGWALQVVASGGGGFSVTADTTTTTLDLNSLTTTGITNFSAVTSLINGPTGIVPIAGKLLTVENYVSANGRVQNLLLNDNKDFRSLINSVWSSWQLIATVDTTPNSDIIDALATPPASPSNGDAYVMLASPTGAWSTFAQGTVTKYNESTVSWVNTVPANGTAITFSNPVNLNSINSYYIAGQTYKYNSAWGSPVIAGLLWQLYVPSSQFQPYNSQSVALSLVSNVVTATCSQNHNLAVGYSVVISASPNTAFNETVTVTAIVSPTVFKYAKTLANATTTGTLKATTQLLPSGCTSALIPSTISFNIIIAVSSGSYGTGSFICKNDRSTPCYIAGIPVGKLESISLITNATPQWETVDKKYTVENIPNHSFTNALHQNKIIVNTGDNEYSWTLADGSDLKKVKDGKFLLNVIDANRVLVANGGNTITTFVPHNLAGDKAYSYGNWYNGGAGNLVDGGTLTVGYRATSNLLSYKNEYQIEWTPTNIFFPVIASTPVALQVEAYNKQFALIDGEKLNNVNNILSLTTSNTKIKISAKTKSVRGKFSGQTVPIRSVDEDFNAALIPVFGLGGLANSANCNPNLDPAIKNINSYGNGGSTINFILAINPVGTLFAIPAPTATPYSHFVDAIGNSAVMTEGQIGFELNPLKGYRHNGTAVELYDFILMGQVTWNGSVLSNLINIAFNKQSSHKISTTFSPITINHNIGTDNISIKRVVARCIQATANCTVGKTYLVQSRDGTVNLLDTSYINSIDRLTFTARYFSFMLLVNDAGGNTLFANGATNFQVEIDLESNY